MGMSNTRLLPHARERIEQWRSARARAGAILIAVDFDGTLAPIQVDPDAVHLPEAGAEVMRALASRADTRVAIISGRSLRDLLQRAWIDGIAYAGNHGFEIRAGGKHLVHEAARNARPQLVAMASALGSALSDIEGVHVEDKEFSLAVHFRRAAESSEAEIGARVRAAARPFANLRIRTGRKIVEILPDVAWDKGRALLWVREQLSLPVGAPALFLGDDRTDEDAFRVVAAHAGGIIVGEPPPHTAATAFVRSPEEVVTLLNDLAAI
jgi:trehalose-phosphatase